MKSSEFELMVMRITIYILLAAGLYVVIGGVEDPMDAVSHSIKVLTK